MRAGDRVRWIGSREQETGTVLDYWEATPLNPLSPTVVVQWDGGEIEDEISLDDLELIDG